MFNTIKKFLFSAKESQNKETEDKNIKTAETKEDKPKITEEIKQKSNSFINFVSDKIEQGKEEFEEMQKKMSNLLETNYKLGLMHLEKGNLTDAIFRFRFIKKFWPNCFDAYYQLAYALVLNKKNQKAKEILIELIAKNPDYDSKAQDLLNRINSKIEEK